MVPRTVNNGTSGVNNDNTHRGVTESSTERYGRGSSFGSHHSRYSSMHNQYQQGLQQQHHLNALQSHHPSSAGLNDSMIMGDDCGSEPNSLAALLAPPSKQPRQHLATDAVTAAALARGDALDAYAVASRAIAGLENVGNVLGGTHPPCVSLREVNHPPNFKYSLIFASSLLPTWYQYVLFISLIVAYVFPYQHQYYAMHVGINFSKIQI